MNTKNLREQRAKLVADFRGIYDRAEKETRSLTADELTTVRKINDDVDALAEQITLAERMAGEERNLVPETQRETRQARAETPAGEPTSDDFAKAVDGYLRRGASGLAPEHRALLAGYTSRAQNSFSGPAGGYLVRPDTSLYTSIVEAMKFFGGVRQMGATTLSTTTGADLPMPTVNDTANKGAIVSEEGSHTGGTDVAIGQRVLKSYLYSSKIVRVSLQLLQDADFPIESFLGGIFGERLGRIQNEHMTIGDGSTKPQGYIAGAQVGKTAASATAIASDELLDLVHSVDRAYRSRGAFSMADSTLLAIRKLKDQQQQYLWTPGLTAGEPDRLLGYPVVINNDIPAIATAKRTIAFGDHSAYYIRDVRGLQVVRLDELYAESAQVGFLAFSRADGALIDAGTGPIKVLVQA